ncbi:MAG: vWA domain-containing protein [Bryobacteraceae bacterium]
MAPQRLVRKPRRRGFALILTALMLVWILPLVGLAIDAGILYAVKAQLQSACDAAALAAARNLSVGLTLSEQEASARARTEAFFDANFPTGHWETTGKSRQVAVAESGFRTRKVTVSGSVTVPLFFMRTLGLSTSAVNASGQAARRDVNVMLVMDRSGSLETAGACDDLETAAMSFVNSFANGRDRLGLVTYGGSYRVDYAPTMNFKNSPTLASQIDLLYPGGCAGWTGSAQAIWKAYEEIVTINEPGALNVILFFTDGKPNSVTADWPLDVNGTPGNSDMTRCYDWEHGKYYYQSGYDPSALTYRGYIAYDNGDDGIHGHQAGAMPTGDPGYVSIPNGYSGSSKSSSYDCWWRSNGSNVSRDVPFYPDNDLYGNSMFGWKSVTTWSSGAYAGKVRYTSNNSGLNAAINAVDNAARRIRNRELNAGIVTAIYAIGLGGAGEAEGDLLLRVSNDADSPIYDVNSPEGLYVYAPTASQLNQAFVRIASEILRYSQ